MIPSVIETSKSKEIEPSIENKKESRFPSNRSILKTLYSHYGRPVNIVRESVKLYLKSTSPSGADSPDWVVDGWQQGRVTIFTGYKENDDDLFYKTKIEKEGVGSWFIGIKDNKIKVSIGGKIDTVLEIGE
jgi:hypothetical protein